MAPRRPSTAGFGLIEESQPNSARRGVDDRAHQQHTLTDDLFIELQDEIELLHDIVGSLLTIAHRTSDPRVRNLSKSADEAYVRAMRHRRRLLSEVTLNYVVANASDNTGA